MKKQKTFGFKADFDLVPKGVTDSEYLRACVKAYKEHSLFDEIIEKWEYVSKGLQVPKGMEIADYIHIAVETFKEDYYYEMEDGQPVFYQKKLNSPKSKPESIFTKMGFGKNNNILPR